MKIFISFLFPLAFAATLSAQGTVKLDPVPSGIQDTIRSYVQQKVPLVSAQPGSIKKAPALKAPLYAILPVESDGGRIFHVILDEPENARPTFYVDSNGDGDLTNDMPADLHRYKTEKGFTNWQGGAFLSLASGQVKLDAHVSFNRYDKKNPENGTWRDVLVYYRDYAYEGKADIGGKTYAVILMDKTSSGDFSGPGATLLVDRDGNGEYDDTWEEFAVQKPFNLGGITYELADLQPLGGVFTVRKSSQSVAETKAPPDHAVGKLVTPFQMADMDGKLVKFPSDYRGKIVMLDFWATWCGPCMSEVPSLAAAYAKYNGKGFDILGITLDSSNQDKAIRATMKDKGMVWREVYDGKGWSAEIALLYFIKSIPAPFLIDGDTGKILAKGDELRGASLAPTLERELKKKGKP